jgi:hypothetical protein
MEKNKDEELLKYANMNNQEEIFENRGNFEKVLKFGNLPENTKVVGEFLLRNSEQYYKFLCDQTKLANINTNSYYATTRESKRILELQLEFAFRYIETIKKDNQNGADNENIKIFVNIINYANTELSKINDFEYRTMDKYTNTNSENTSKGEAFIKGLIGAAISVVGLALLSFIFSRNNNNS